MKVKIGNKIYDGEKEPVMVILTDYDKENISQMIKKAHKYAQFPSNMTEEEMKKFMGIKRKKL
jgi:hypothetical protein